MAKYRISEEQLQKIFEKLENDKLSESDNYPPGSDKPDAPWNDDKDKKTNPIKTTGGDYDLFGASNGEYLILDKVNNILLYTLDEVWDKEIGNKWIDIKDQLEDFLEIKQVEDGGDEGSYLTNRPDWKDYVSENDVANALVEYLNFNKSKGVESGIVNSDEFLGGKGYFLHVTQDDIDEINNETLAEKALSFFN